MIQSFKKIQIFPKNKAPFFSIFHSEFFNPFYLISFFVSEVKPLSFSFYNMTQLKGYLLTKWCPTLGLNNIEEFHHLYQHLKNEATLLFCHKLFLHWFYSAIVIFVIFINNSLNAAVGSNFSSPRMTAYVNRKSDRKQSLSKPTKKIRLSLNNKNVL